MFRFSKPGGSSFDLDYTGPVHAFDSGNDLIAICPGKEIFDIELEEFECLGDPTCYYDWEIVVVTDNDFDETILQRALAMAWSALSLCERLVVSKCPEE